jgi:2-dehydro-3-deoxygalactonokinase
LDGFNVHPKQAYLEMSQHLIAIDWGTSSFRGYLTTSAGDMLDAFANGKGILHCGTQGFEAVLEESVGKWMDQYPQAPIIACGMIASRQGWIEAPYLKCPAGLAEFAQQLISLDLKRGRKIWFVPGAMYRSESNIPDVMRGEETQILGRVGRDQKRFSFVMPGTHSKWVVVEKGKLSWFTTFMTGEIFAILLNHSILGRLIEEGPHDSRAFQKGLSVAKQAAQKGQGVMNRLFSVRSLGLFNEISSTSLKAYLSGILIGAEVAEATLEMIDKVNVQLIGDKQLIQFYQEALRFFGWPSEPLFEDLAAKGLLNISKGAGLIG